MDYPLQNLSKKARQTWQAELSLMPRVLAESTQHKLRRLLSVLNDEQRSVIAELPAERGQRLVRMIAGSDFALNHLCRRPCSLPVVVTLPRQADADYYWRRVRTCLQSTDDKDAAMRALRELRQFEQLALIWRECGADSSMWQTVEAQSAFADACVMQALEWLHAHAPQGRDLPLLVVFALGKLGAHALNLSSDIDVIFMQPDETRQKMFYTMEARDLVHLIGARTRDGFVFRVDARLRPDGNSGALVNTPSAMQKYYQERAREWERFAWTRARALTHHEAGNDFLRAIEGFIYKNYSDYSVVDWLRNSPWRSNQTHFDVGRHTDLKQGHGGIREIEFIVQTFQLIHGGKDKHLRSSRMSSIFERLSRSRYLGEECGVLVHAYQFLRNSEHAVQTMADQQTHRLPADELGRAQLAYLMGFHGEDGWMRYQTAYESVRHEVQTIFSNMTNVGWSPKIGREKNTAWQWLNDKASGEQAENALQAARAQLLSLGMDAESILQSVVQLADKAKRYKLAAQALANLMPVAMQALLSVEISHRQQAFEGLLKIVETGLGRSNYLVLLSETPYTSERVLQVCAESRWLASNLNHHLFALEYLADEIPVGEQVDFKFLKKYLSEVLHHDLLALPDNKPDLPMNFLRRFKQGWLMRIAYADVAGSLPLMKVSDYLTAVADAIIEQAMRLAWDHLKNRHGAPVAKDGRAFTKDDFLIVAYGKLGSLEMSYASDCDLVFIYRSAAMDSSTTGDRPISASQFFARLGQRIIHLLNSTTTTGVAYKVDMRLRPDGSQGLLVSSIDAYRDYHLHHARLWERQSLTKARAVNKDNPLAEQFTGLRRQILTRPAEEDVRKTILELRQKTRTQKKPPENQKQFHLKYSSGGSMDVEFIVQCCLLLHACRHPSIIRYTDNIRQLDALIACGCISRDHGRALQAAWQHLRAFSHSCVLRMRPPIVPFSEIESSAKLVNEIRRALMRENSEHTPGVPEREKQKTRFL